MAHTIRQALVFAASQALEVATAAYAHSWSPDKEPGEANIRPSMHFIREVQDLDADEPKFNIQTLPGDMVSAMMSSPVLKPTLAVMARDWVDDDGMPGAFLITEASALQLRRDEPRPEGNLWDQPGSKDVILVFLWDATGTTLFVQDVADGQPCGEPRVIAADAEEGASLAGNMAPPVRGKSSPDQAAA